MRSRQKVSHAGLALIEGFEGFRRTAARLPDGRWTIGYGHTRSAREGAEVSAEQAEMLLIFDLMPVTEAVNELVFSPLEQNQFDALCAFAFNVGVDAFRGSDVLKRINEGRLTEAACEFDLWRKADIGGDPIVLDALVRRRAAEKSLFLTPSGGFTPTPSALVRPSRDLPTPKVLPTSQPEIITAPMDGVDAEVHRVAPVAPQTEPAPVAPPVVAPPVVAPPVVEAAPEPVQPAPVLAEPVLAETVAPAPVAPEPVALPSVGVEMLSPAAPTSRPVTPSPDALSYFAPETLAPETLSSPPVPPVADVDAPSPQPARTVTSTANVARIYGPMGVAALGRGGTAAPPPHQPPAVEPAPVETPQPEPVAPEPVAPEPVAPEPVAPEPVAPEPVAPEPVASEPAAFAEPPPTPQPPPFAAPPTAEPLVLTHPPEDWEPRTPPQPEAAPLTEVADANPSLFGEAWGGGPTTRVVRHEDPAGVPVQNRARGSARYVLMAIVGLVASGGAIFAFLKGRAGGGGDLVTYTWLLAVIGALCVATSVYFLLKRLGGAED